MISSCAGQACEGQTPYPATLLAANATMWFWAWDATEKTKQNAMNARRSRGETSRRSGIRKNLFILRGKQLGVCQRSPGGIGSPVDPIRFTRLAGLLEPKCFEAKMFRSWRSVQLWKFGTKCVGSHQPLIRAPNASFTNSDHPIALP